MGENCRASFVYRSARSDSPYCELASTSGVSLAKEGITPSAHVRGNRGGARVGPYLGSLADSRASDSEFAVSI